MSSAARALVLLCCGVACATAKPAPPSSTVSTAAVASNDSTASLISFSASPDIFPSSWADATAEPVPLEDRAWALRAVEAGLRKYPSRLLSENLTGVFLVRRLRVRGITMGGTNGRSRVYVSVGSIAAGSTPDRMEKVLHAELSSILLRNYRSRLPLDEWLAANPAVFRYGRGGTDAVRSGLHSQKSDDELLELGFLHLYGTASQEEDFNSYAAALLSGDRNVWAAAAKYPAVLRKVKLTIGFYGYLDQHFEVSAFRALAQLDRLPAGDPLRQALDADAHGE